jgi:hypothetical protein
MDLNPVGIDDPSGRIAIYRGDQRDLQLLDRMARECAPDGFDIIIDDASHIAKCTKISFWHLFDNLRPGGYYVIEDWRVSYWEGAEDGARYEWPEPTQARPIKFSPTEEPKAQFPNFVERISRRGKKLLDAVGMETFTGTAARLYRNVKCESRRFPSHDYGMVGLIKQLMDELGMDAITSPERNGPPPQRFPKFQRMEVCPGQVFIVKATEQDDGLIAESWLHPFPAIAHRN